MIITTIQEANLIACGCCSLPTCEDPQQECQSLFATADASTTEEPSNPEAITGQWGGFIQPAGDDLDDIPAIYRNYANRENDYNGRWGDHELKSEELDGGPTAECPAGVTIANGLLSKNVITTTNGKINLADFTSITSEWTKCGTAEFVFQGTTTTTDQLDPFEPTWTSSTPPADLCTVAAVKDYDSYSVADYSAEPSDPSPIPYDQAYVYTQWAEDASWGVGFFGELADDITKAELITKTIDEIPDEWPDPATGGECKASLAVTWPLIGEVDWPTCGNPPVEVSAEAQAIKSRYRFAPPEIWFEAWDAWKAGGEIGPEPPVRSTWEMEWDEIFFPDGHDRTINDPDVEPPDPLPEGWEHPQIPDPDAPNPSLIASRSWIWGGDPNSRWSSWYVLDVPTTEGETRVVNITVICWKSARLGGKPTAYGEIYELETPPP